MRKAISIMTLSFIILTLYISYASRADAAPLIGYADTVLDYLDSGEGPIAGPYGGTFPGVYPEAVPLDVILGDDPGTSVDFLSLPKNSFVTVGFTDETIFDGSGNDIFIRETGGNGERADVFVSSDLTAYTYLGTAVDNKTTSFDLGAIGYKDPVVSIKIVGLDNFGGSPGFDVVNVQGLPGSIHPITAVPEPRSMLFLLTGIPLLFFRKR